MSNRIAIIIPYFGKFPNWMSLFVEGCRRNNFIDFIIYSDNVLKYHADNIIYYELSFEKYCNKVSESLGIAFNPQTAYKLCGLKPFYGYIHREELKNYEFWGFCDIDLLLGDLRKFLTGIKLSGYEVISTDWDRISGPFCILKNCDKIIRMCFKIHKWQDKLMSEEIIPLDEKYLSDLFSIELKLLRGIDSILLRPVFPIRIVKIIERFISKPIHMLLKKRGLFFSFLNCSPEIGDSSMCFLYKNNVIIDTKTDIEIPYLHFLFFKKNIYRKSYLWDESACLITDELHLDYPIMIDKNGIYNVSL